MGLGDKGGRIPIPLDKLPCALGSRSGRTATLVLAGPGRGSCPRKAGADNSSVLCEFRSGRQGAGLAPAADSPALDAEGAYGEEGVKDVQRG